MRLRVLTMNVQNDAGDPRRTELLNAEFRRLDPDVLVLQEVRYPGETGQLRALLAGTRLHATHQADVLARMPPGADRYGGSAVATRWPHRVAGTAEHATGWTLAVAYALPGLGEQLLITPTTPWEFHAEPARERQARAIAELDLTHRRCCPPSSPATSTRYRRRPASGS